MYYEAMGPYTFAKTLNLHADDVCALVLLFTLSTGGLRTGVTQASLNIQIRAFALVAYLQVSLATLAA